VKTGVPIRGRNFRVEDSSMEPYLSQGDQLWVEEENNGQPRFGQLVLVQNRVSGKYLVRRFFPGGRLISDQPSLQDGPSETSENLRIVGVVTGRMQASSSRWIPYGDPRTAHVHRVQAALAWIAQGEQPIQRVARSALRLVGNVFRRIEERW
jgi:hypothetical protein